MMKLKMITRRSPQRNSQRISAGRVETAFEDAERNLANAGISFATVACNCGFCDSGSDTTTEPIAA